MNKYKIIKTKQVDKDLKKHLKSGHKASIKRIEQIFIELTKHPYSGIGNPKALKYDLSGYWSREINEKDRLIYQINDEIITVSVVSAMRHYTDK